MTIRPWILRTIAFGVVVMAGVVGLLAYSAILLARTFATIGAQVLAGMLAQIASMVYLMAVMEIVTAMVAWATQGPIMALSWVASRFAAWQGL